GDDRVRFCPQCRLHVYNLSAMSRSEAQALVLDKEGLLCARFFRRLDGTVLTQDCPIGIRTGRRPWFTAAAIAAWIMAVLGGSLTFFGFVALNLGRDGMPANTAAPQRQQVKPRECIMGKIDDRAFRQNERQIQ